MYTLEDIQAVDMEVANAITDEFERQNSHIELIASENWVSKAVMSAMGSVLTNKYAEGYPGKRYYGGCECVDVVEELARERICSNIDIQDSISRSLGILKYARTITHDEALQLLSNVRLGIVSGQLKDVPLLTIDKLMTDVEPATLMVNSGKNLSAAQRDVARADLLRKALEEV